ncbi:MAG TPA: hypothetical protein VHY33_09255 [Thermoanaerobaculia bacterium]|jgi:hypothetical protein|nr:hypothetical protein [Thermoanaerobaculia bacterium]
MKRRWAFAAIAVCVLAVFAPALIRNEVFSLRDHSGYFQPLHWFTANELRHGRLPLWNVYNASGEPWLANPQTGVFYPPASLFVILPFARAYVLYLALHVLLLGCGAYLLFARLTSSGGGALTAALTLMFCGPVMSLLDVSNNLTTFAWLPLIVWCALSEVSAMTCGAVMALSFLAGEPFFASIGALLFVIVRRRGWVDTLEAAAMAFALSAVQLFPFLGWIANSDRARGGVPKAEILLASMPLRDWMWLAIPPKAGRVFDPSLGQQFLPMLYAGLLTIIFAMIGIVAARRRAAGWTALILLSALVAAGSHIAPVGNILSALPLTIFRYPARLVPFAVLGICALAAFGVNRAIRSEPLKLVLALVTVVDLAVRIQPLLATEPFNPLRVPYPAAIGRDSKIVRAGATNNTSRDAWILGYLNLYQRRFDTWTASPILAQRYANVIRPAIVHADLSVLNEVSAGYILAARPLAAFRPVAEVRGVVVHRNVHAFPLAYFQDAAHRVTEARMLAFTPSSVFIDVDARSAGEVIVTQQMSSGWRVEVDGVRAVANDSALFRTVHVAAGHHAVKWIYRPASLLAGAIVTMIAIARMLFSRWFVKRDARENFLREDSRIA